MTNEFTHNCTRRTPSEDCAACVLEGFGADENGVPNYSAWPLAFMQNGRAFPSILAITSELKRAKTENLAYYNHVVETAAKLGYELPTV